MAHRGRSILRKAKKKFNPNGNKMLTVAAMVVAFGLIGGAIAVFISRAATSVTIDTSLPVPHNVKAFGDDQSIIVSTGTDFNQNVDSRVVGYYITYRPKGSTEPYKVRQQMVRRDFKNNMDFSTAIQLQPLPNGVEYEINIQSAAGSFVNYSNGDLTYGGSSWSSKFPIANGNVSNKVTVFATTSSARVDSMRQRLTGFFDDFNQPAGPFDEKKWNTASTACISPGTAAAFINDQFHSHNQIRSSCDRAGIASRPRAIFDITGATEENPAVIEFDLDGASQPRDTWYLDIIPLSSRTNNIPIDITSHNDLFDSDSEDPGNMIRINSRRDATSFAYYNVNRSPAGLSDSGEPTCMVWCTPIIKPGLSPLPYPDAPKTPNVRSQWVVHFTPTKMRVFENGRFIASKLLPAEFASQKKYVLHSTIFSYNTGKDFDQIMPYVQLLHWDNFGFSGPAPTQEVYNYLEGGPTGTTPVFSTSTGGTFSMEDAPRTTIIPVPDPIGNVVNGQAQLYFTLQNTSSGTWTWSPNDHILVNGKRYNVPDPATLVRSPLSLGGCNQYSAPYVPFSMAIPINKADLVQGNNSVRFNISGTANDCAGRSPTVFNVHLEIPYAKSDTSKPAYSSPTAIFGEAYRSITKPPFTSCDQFWFVERDLGLPYEAGKTNLDVTKGCVLLDGHHTPGTGTTTPPPPIGQAPTVSITSSTTSAASPASFTVTGTATDADGTIAKLEIFQGNTSVKTCTSSPCTFNASNISTGSYNYSAVATDNSGNSVTSSTVSVTVEGALPNPENNLVTWSNIDVGSNREPTATIQDSVYPDSQGVQFLYNGNIYQNASRPNGYDATGPREGSTYHMFPALTISTGDTLEARWKDLSGATHRSVIVVGEPSTNPADTTAPTVSITSPANNATVAGTVTVSASASDNMGVTRVSYYLDNATTPFSNDTTAPYTSSWVTTSVSNGSHTIKATAVDEAGNIGTSAIVTVNVQNTVSDTTAPTTSITSPANNATVSNTIAVLASAADNIGVTKVELLIDGQLSATDTTSPYSFSLNTANLSEGQHTLRTRAYDAANNNTLSSTVTITVNNVADPPSVCEDPTANNLGQPLPCTYDTPTPKTGDVNNDGNVNVFDISIILNNWLRPSPTREQGDLNGDGNVNVFDISIVLNNWLK